MFKALILQAQHNLSDARMEFMIRNRLSWMRFLRFDLGGPTPDENTIRLFRNKLTETGTLKRVMKAFDWQLQKKGYIPMSGQIVDASLVPAPKQRNTDAEKEAIKAGKTAREIWPDEPNKAAQKDTDARWTVPIRSEPRTSLFGSISVDQDDLAQIFDTKVGEGYDAAVAEVVNPDQAVFGFHLIGDVREPLLILGEVTGDTVNREDVMDFIGLHDQAARALDCGVQFHGINFSMLATG